MDYERRGGILDESAIKVVEKTLFSQVVDGSGEVAAAHFDRVETGVEGRVAADSPLLIRPEAYEAQLTGRSQRLDERSGEQDAREIALDERAKELEAQAQALAQREQEIEALVLQAVEEQVDRRASEVLESERARLVSTIAQLDAIVSGLMDQARVDLLELSVKIAERILGAELKTRPQLLVGLIRSALEAAQLSGAITLVLSQKDYDLLRSKGPQVLGKLPQGLKLQLRADPELKRGDLLIESAAGRLDATLSARLQRVGASLSELTGET
tara:strand:- start:1056 stop:1868 length:813 start_codon:yes stop_codon:yes gene_type:complete